MKNARLSRLDQALLAGPSSNSSFTRPGRYAPIAGEKNAEKHVASTARITTQMTGRSRKTTAAMTIMITPRMMSVVSSTSRRSKRSATIPAGIDNRMWADSCRADDAEHERILRQIPDDDQQRDKVKPVAYGRYELTEQQPGKQPVAGRGGKRR